MKKSLVFATTNKGKIREIRSILGEIKNYEIKFMDDIKEIKIEPPEEIGNSFEENSISKAKYYSVFFPESLVASEDSGLMVDALNGAPGIHSARFNNLRDDEEKVNLVLNMMKDLPDEKRGAKFVCVVALVEQSGLKKIFRGETYGKISFEPRGKNGFGYDPIFIPEGETRTFAEMEEGEKNFLSHRKKALLKLKEYLSGRDS